MIKTITILLSTFLLCVASYAQSTTETDSLTIEKSLLSEISEHQMVIDSLRSILKAIEDKAITYPYWTFGGGTLSGFDFNNFSNWANRGDNFNSSASSFTLGANGFANQKGKNYFWRNRTRINLGWQRFQRSNTDEDAQFQKIADMMRIVSHYGYNINPKLAMSTLTEWESNLISQDINVSYLDVSVGFTYTPNDNFVSIMHPINYEVALSDDQNIESSPGAKLIMEYTNIIEQRLSLASQFTGFLSYEEIDFLSNFTWTNRVNIKVLKGLGIGLEYALRVSPQETFEINLTDENLQSYFVMGMSFEII